MSDPSLLSPEYKGTKLLIFTAIFIPTQIIAVALRYLARYLVEGPWGLDDVLVFMSLSLQMCMAGLSIGSVYKAGVGYHVRYLEETKPHLVSLCRKYVFAITIIYFGSVNLPKVAILSLYHRVFPRKNLRLAVWIIFAILVCLEISTVITGLAECTPFEANWNPDLQGAHCINKLAFYRYGSIPNILTDIAMLILPLKAVWKLQTSTRLKIGLIATFTVGSAGLVTSIIRFAIFFLQKQPADGTWSAVELFIWTQVEPGVYLISACLMNYRPLLERIGKKGKVFRKPTRQSKTSPSSSSRSSDHHFATRSNPSRRDVLLNDDDIPLHSNSRTESGGGGDKRGFHRLENDSFVVEPPRITVTTKISVSEDVRRRADVEEPDVESGVCLR